jgi:branched-chain amino acid transport system ATP-binding protein
MMLEPSVALLDEPTLGLDPLNLAIIRDAIVVMNRAGTTILMVEQNVRFGLSLAHRATVMSGGRAALSGAADDVSSHPNLMDIFFGTATHDEVSI